MVIFAGFLGKVPSLAPEGLDYFKRRCKRAENRAKRVASQAKGWELIDPSHEGPIFSHKKLGIDATIDWAIMLDDEAGKPGNVAQALLSYSAAVKAKRVNEGKILWSENISWAIQVNKKRAKNIAQLVHWESQHGNPSWGWEVNDDSSVRFWGNTKKLRGCSIKFAGEEFHNSTNDDIAKRVIAAGDEYRNRGMAEALQRARQELFDQGTVKKPQLGWCKESSYATTFKEFPHGGFKITGTIQWEKRPLEALVKENLEANAGAILKDTVQRTAKACMGRIISKVPSSVQRKCSTDGLEKLQLEIATRVAAIANTGQDGQPWSAGSDPAGAYIRRGSGERAHFSAGWKLEPGESIYEFALDMVEAAALINEMERNHGKS